MSKVIAIVNQKGGVAKTVIALNLGYALSEMGKKVLLIDFDPQSSLTVCFGYDNTDSINTTVYNLMSLAIEEKNLPEKEDYIFSTGNIDLIPCNLELSVIEIALVNVMSRELILKSIIDEIKEEYDYVIIDCSPLIGMLTINVLAACDSVVIPVTPQYLSAKGLELLLKNIIRVKKRINPKIQVDGIPLTMYAERYMDTMLGTNGLTEIFNIFFSFDVSLIVLKFLKKGFEQYIFWTEGDADSILMITGFFKALAIVVCFPTLYSWLGQIIEELTDKLIKVVSKGMVTDFTAIINGISSAGLFIAIISLIFFICFFLLYLQFLMRGMEILILRIGIPVACVGLLDSDNGVFRTYIQKLFQSTLAVLVQIVLAKGGVALMLNTHVVWGVAVLMLAIKTPRFLQEFIIVSGGHGAGLMGNAYQSVRLVQMAK